MASQLEWLCWKAAVRRKTRLHWMHKANKCSYWFFVIPHPPTVLSRRENSFLAGPSFGGAYFPGQRWWSLPLIHMIRSHPLHSPIMPRNCSKVRPPHDKSSWIFWSVKSSDIIGASKVATGCSVNSMKSYYKVDSGYHSPRRFIVRKTPAPMWITVTGATASMKGSKMWITISLFGFKKIKRTDQGLEPGSQRWGGRALVSGHQVMVRNTPLNHGMYGREEVEERSRDIWKE